jgi:AraC-like DNA-binding protein
MEVALLANGDEHWIADAVGRDLVPSDNAAKACELLQPLFQDGTITNELICGVVRFDEELIHPILHGLPEILHFTGIEHDAAIWTTAMTIDTHLRSGGSLLEPIVDRLAEALFLQLLERHVETQETTGFLSSLNDRRMNLAITLLHQQLEFNWSLASLGEKTGMSRATLIRRFQEAVGMSPMAYLTQWRLMKAHSLVKYSPKTMEQISQSIGFSSSRTFSKAFVRAYGYSPSELRRRASKQ